MVHEEMMLKYPDADSGVMLKQATDLVKQRRQESAEKEAAAAPVVVPKSLEALKEMFGLKPASEVK